jgi:hypothetical protein
VDREAADDASEVAVADPTATGKRRGGREGDTLYRRPPAHPPVDSTTGGSWFTDGTDVPAESEPAAPDFGPATPRSSNRTSFGFSDGPISPKRSAPTSGPPAAAVLPPEPPSPAEPLIRRKPAPPVPASSNWPPPARLTPEPDPADRVPGALRAPSGEFATSWRNDTAERRGAALRAPSGEIPRWGSDTAERRGAALRAPSAEIASWGNDTGESRAVRREREREREVVAEPLPPPRQSRAVTIGMLVLSAVVLLAGTVMGVVYFSGSDQDIDSVLQLGAGDTGKRTVTAPLDNRTSASFELLAGANSVHVTIGELGDDLYRISTPDDAGILPDPTIRNDDVKLQVSKDGDGTGGEIDVVLAAKVRWALRFSGYAEKQVIDVSGGQISQLEMVAAMRTAEVTLSQPSGTVPVKINGAVDSLILKSPEENPVRIKVGGGASTVVAGARTLKDVAAGSTLTPKGWNVANRYDLTAGARITTLTIENA